MEFKDYYKILGLAREATQDEIKSAYRRLARKYHPDVSKEANAEERFKEVGEAYEALRDPEKRAAYDHLLDGRWQEGQEFRPPPGWDSGFEFSGGFDEDAGGRHFSEFFETLFGGLGGRRARARGGIRGDDHHARIKIGLEDAYRGATRTITLQVAEGNAQGTVDLRPHSLKVKIPAGVTEGQRIRLAGQGGRALGNAPRGDLYLEVLFEPHPVFTADGRDVFINLPIAPWESALGAKVPVPTLGGTVDLKIPAGTQSGQRLRLKGRGLPGSPPGDQYAVIQIHAPKAENEAQRRLYEQLAKAAAFNPRAAMGV
jgi:curved DNA-binding protein